MTNDNAECKHIYGEEKRYSKCGYCPKKFDCIHKALKTGLSFSWLDDMK